jgi:hypothetical protein
MKPVDLQAIEEGAAAGFELGGPWGAAAGALGGALAGGDAVDITFSSHRGSSRTYRYRGAAAVAIMGGDDPSKYPGERIA